MASKHTFDLELFLRLNKEYESKPVVARPRTFDEQSLDKAAAKRLTNVERQVDLSGKRVLEIGSGRGHICRRLADHYGCEVVGVDIKQYEQWDSLSGRNVDLRIHDVSADDNAALGTFDLILSFAVWEHIEHPHAALHGVKELLGPEGRAYIYANLYRGPKASHRYRDIFFPWPHLLFTDEVFEEFYLHTIGHKRRAAWVNKLTAAHYSFYFDQLDLVPERLFFSKDVFDAEFYDRFEDVLGRYPRFDLSHDFIHAVLRHADTAPIEPPAPAKRRALSRFRWGN